MFGIGPAKSRCNGAGLAFRRIDRLDARDVGGEVFWEAGCLSRQTPGRHSCEGRIGRGAKPPPQFGQTLCSLSRAQSAQKVHS